MSSTMRATSARFASESLGIVAVKDGTSSPGPGAYSSPTVFSRIVAKARQRSKKAPPPGGSAERFRNPPPSPGPGEYKVDSGLAVESKNRSRVVKSARLRPSRSDVDLRTKGWLVNRDLPETGPGSHTPRNYDMGVQAANKRIMRRGDGSLAAKDTFGTTARFAPAQTCAPGPGTHSSEVISDFNPRSPTRRGRVAQGWQQPVGVSNGKSGPGLAGRGRSDSPERLRFPTSDSPGPGSYERVGDFSFKSKYKRVKSTGKSGQAGFLASGKRFEDKTTETPGPGQYLRIGIPPLPADRPHSRSATRLPAPAMSDRIMFDIPETPGPGSYNVATSPVKKTMSRNPGMCGVNTDRFKDAKTLTSDLGYSPEKAADWLEAYGKWP